MLKIFTTLTAIGTVMISPAFIGNASAQNVEIEITNEKTVKDDDTLNYFASGAKQAEERAAIQSEQLIDGPAVPARELQYLPESVEIGGQGAAKVKVIDGRLVTETVSSPQAAPSAAPAPATQQPVATHAAPIASEAPKTLNQQLQQKHGNAPQQPAVAQPPAAPAASKPAAPAPAAQPAPAPVQTATTPASNAAATEPASGAGVGHSAVVDRAKGAKINIISNTDTGVKLGQ